MSTELKNLKVVVSTEQLAQRVRELAREISDDYRGKTLHAVCVLENGFMFMADLVRALDVPVVCQFVKPQSRELNHRGGSTREIFYAPEVDVRGQHVLVVEGIVKSGITQEFLLRNLMARGAATVKLAALVDKPSERRVALEAGYFGYPMEDDYFLGYGLGSPLLGRNLPYLATASRSAAAG